MKQTTITLLLLWPVTVLFSQEVFRPGIVKGKNVTYHVSKGEAAWMELPTREIAILQLFLRNL